MSLELCILASGSSGNSTILRSPAGVMLIDAGIGPRTAAKRMAGTGVTVADVKAICLTHLDSDHFTPTWLGTIQKQGIRLFCHETRAQELQDHISQLDAQIDIGTFDGHPFEPMPELRFRALKFDHDQTGSHGFLVEGFGCKVGYATDLGRVPAHLIERFCGVDLLALESNYDPEMEINSSRPYFLKQRIMGGRGHLSNQQAFNAVRSILDRCQATATSLPQHIVLLHRSRQCNCPKLLRKLFEADRRIAPRLTLAEQYERSAWLGVRNRSPLIGEQLYLPM